MELEDVSCLLVMKLLLAESKKNTIWNSHTDITVNFVTDFEDLTQNETDDQADERNEGIADRMPHFRPTWSKHFWRNKIFSFMLLFVMWFYWCWRGCTAIIVVLFRNTMTGNRSATEDVQRRHLGRSENRACVWHIEIMHQQRLS